MNNKYQNDLDAIIKLAQKAALQEVDDRLQQRWDLIDRILTNGRPIWEQTFGERFETMYKLRLKLLTKMQSISEAQGVIFEIMYKK